MIIKVPINDDIEFKLRQVSKKRKVDMAEIAKEVLLEWVSEEDEENVKKTSPLDFLKKHDKSQ